MIESWRVEPLSDLLEIMESGSRPKGGVSSINGGVPSIGGEHLDSAGGFCLHNLRFVPPAFFSAMKKGVIRPHDILVVKDGATTGKTSYVSEVFPHKEAAINEHVFLLRANPNKIIPRFLFYYLFSPSGQAQILSSFQGAAIGGIPRSFAQLTKVPLPPIAEQGRIVKLLDAAEELRRLRAAADRRTADLIPALFYDMFGDPTVNPEGWPSSNLGDVCDCRLGKMLDAKQQTGTHAKPYLRNANVQWGRFDLSEVYEMDFDPDDQATLRLRRGDILICEGGEVGRAAIWNEELPECYFQKALHRARPDPARALPEYLLYLLWSMAKGQCLVDFTTEATIKHLTGVKLKSMPIMLPPLPLQRTFAEHVTKILALEAAQAQSRQRLDDLFQSMLHRAFRGEL